jgi:hypothetical protein
MKEWIAVRGGWRGLSQFYVGFISGILGFISGVPWFYLGGFRLANSPLTHR